MPAFKYLANNAGVTTEIQAKDVSAGAGDAGKAVALNASGLIDPTMLPGADVDIIEASENLAAGDLVNVHDSSGPKVRKADAAGGMAKRTDGDVLASVTSGQNATVYFDGNISGLSSLTPGARYYLSATPGGVTATAPTTAAHLKQFIGKAIS